MPPGHGRDHYETRGQQPYRRASEAKSGHRFDISDLNYVHIHVHIANSIYVWSFMMASEDTAALEIKFGLRYEISELNFLHITTHNIL